VSEKIKSWDELKQLRADIKNKARADSETIIIAVGTGTCGAASGANEIMTAIQDEIEKSGVKNAKVVPTGCYGFCYAEPMVEVRAPGGNTIYGPVDDDLARQIVNGHIVNGKPIEASIIKQEVEKA
jgi:(2Fe-2S) ferredoxin